MIGELKILSYRSLGYRELILFFLIFISSTDAALSVDDVANMNNSINNNDNYENLSGDSAKSLNAEDGNQQCLSGQVVNSNIYAYTSIIIGLIGIIIGSVLTFFITMKRMEMQARISYISTILKDDHVRTNLADLIQSLTIDEKTEGTQIDIESQINQAWFFLLFSPSERSYSKLKTYIENKEWEKSLEIISRILRGIW